MKQVFILFLVCTAISSIVSSLCLAQNITSGLWKAQTKIKLNKLSLPSIDVEDCISPPEAKDIKKYIQENLIPETQCTITKWDYKNPNLKVSLSCENSQYDSKGNLTGKVTDKAFNISGILSGSHVLMGEVDVGIDYNGTYLKTCK
jgi:hypothetical protein